MKKSVQGSASNASELITKYIQDRPDWRGEMLSRLRKIILDAAPELTEDWKWAVPVWSHKGLVCSASAFKDYVKLNFLKGASLKDPKRLFNAGLEGKTQRAIDFHKGDKIDAAALKALVRAAVTQNELSNPTR